jgi:hypothetical protein
MVPGMNWERFTYDYHLDLTSRALRGHLITIEAYKEAALNLVLPPEWRSQLDKLNRVRVVHGTTALEGMGGSGQPRRPQEARRLRAQGTGPSGGPS